MQILYAIIDRWKQNHTEFAWQLAEISSIALMMQVSLRIHSWKQKLILNSRISDARKGARFLSADLKDRFLASPMEENEYMWIRVKYLLDDILLKYDIESLINSDGYVYVRIKKGIYGLKQAAILDYNHLVKQLKPHGYHTCPETTGLWLHRTRKTKFCLCVDGFGVKYFSKDDADRLLTALFPR